MTEPRTPPPPGPAADRTLSGRYELGEVVGYGGMAEVHRGRDVRLGREVAIKTLRADLARDPAFQARFRREAQSAAALNHPSIVAVYDTGEGYLDGRSVPYIVMEFVDGRTLRDVLAGEGRLHWTRALEVTDEILTALEYSHRQGIIHRDIKPGNVMLSGSGAVKVMDFGIARAAGAGATMTQTATVIGTAQYLSPEQARGEPVDARSDLYSAGCLLYELLTGRPPFTGDSPVAIAYQHVREDPVPPSRINDDVPPSVDAVVLKAMAKNPANRYQSAAEMSADIERALGGQPVQATPVLPDDLTATQRLAPTATARLPAYPAPPTAAAGPRRPSDRRRRRGLAFGLLAVAATFLGPRLRGGERPGVTVGVPAVVGVTLDEARERIEGAGLRVGGTEHRTDAKPKGTVIEQSPAADETVRVDSAVDLTVSDGPELVGVPNVVGLPVDTATKTLRDVGLAAGPVTEKDSDQRAGRVLSTDPPPDAEVATGTKINLVVASGKTSIPYVVGRERDDAQGVLERAGFTVEVRRQDTPDRDQDGVVIAQEPNGGSAEPGSTVTLRVGNYERRATPSPTETPSPTSTETTPPPTSDAAPRTQSSPTPTPAPTAAG